MRFIPGDICLVRWVDYGQNLRPERLTYCRNELGLNDPLFSQFLRFITGVLTFDFGVSMWTGRPIIEELELRFALSLQVAIMAKYSFFNYRATPWRIIGGEAEYLD